jgi:hypothetical protein
VVLGVLYGRYEVPPEYVRARAARYWGVPPWDPMLDCPYYVNLALACEHVEGEIEAHLRNKES